MTHHLSEYDLWGMGDNVVAALPPSPGDLFVLVTIAGRLALNWPIAEYERAVRVSEAFARRIRSDHPVNIKILCVSLAEARAMGFAPADTFDDMPSAQEVGVRQLVVATCTEALRNSGDPAVRADAYDLLVSMGVIRK